MDSTADFVSNGANACQGKEELVFEEMNEEEYEEYEAECAARDDERREAEIASDAEFYAKQKQQECDVWNAIDCQIERESKYEAGCRVPTSPYSSSIDSLDDDENPFEFISNFVDLEPEVISKPVVVPKPVPKPAPVMPSVEEMDAEYYAHLDAEVAAKAAEAARDVKLAAWRKEKEEKELAEEKERMAKAEIGLVRKAEADRERAKNRKQGKDQSLMTVNKTVKKSTATTLSANAQYKLEEEKKWRAACDAAQKKGPVSNVVKQIKMGEGELTEEEIIERRRARAEEKRYLAELRSIQVTLPVVEEIVEEVKVKDVKVEESASSFFTRAHAALLLCVAEPEVVVGKKAKTKNQSSTMCRNFLAGNCRYGDNCLFSHTMAVKIEGDESIVGTGFMCHYKAPLEACLKGKDCPYGANCRYEHPEREVKKVEKAEVPVILTIEDFPELNPKVVAKADMKAEVAAAAAAEEEWVNVKVVERKSKVPECKFGAKCTYGARCKFAHTAVAQVVAKRPAERGMSSTPCREFVQTGKCKFGARCKFAH